VFLQEESYQNKQVSNVIPAGALHDPIINHNIKMTKENSSKQQNVQIQE